MTKLKILRVPGNSLQPAADTPDSLWPLTYLDISRNLGNATTCPEWVDRAQRLRVYLNMSHTNLTGEVQWCVPLSDGPEPDIQVLDVSRNKLTGQLSLPANQHQWTLVHVNASHNQLSGLSIYQEAIHRLQRLEVIDLSNNPNLAGEWGWMVEQGIYEHEWGKDLLRNIEYVDFR